MPILDQVFHRRTLGRWGLGLALLAALVVWVEHQVGWGALLAPWLDFRPRELLLALGLTALSYGLRAVRVYDYTHALLRGAFPATLRLSLIHNALNNFLPMRLGELAYPVLMKRYFGQGLTAAGVTLLWIRVLDLHFLGLIALLFLYLSWDGVVWLALIPVWLALVPGMYWAHGRLHGYMDGREGRAARLLGRVLGHVPDSAGRFLRIWLWTALSWSLKVLAYALVVLHFVDIGVGRAVLGIIGAELSTVLPVHGIAGSGSYELAMGAVLLPLGVDMQTLLRAAVNLHLYLLATSLLFALLAPLLPRARRGGAG